MEGVPFPYFLEALIHFVIDEQRCLDTLSVFLGQSFRESLPHELNAPNRQLPEHFISEFEVET